MNVGNNSATATVTLSSVEITDVFISVLLQMSQKTVFIYQDFKFMVIIRFLLNFVIECITN